MTAGDYTGAEVLYDMLGDYADSADRLKAVRYDLGVSCA